jgi:hypothetical protein
MSCRSRQSTRTSGPDHVLVHRGRAMPAAQQLLVTPERPYNAIEAEPGDAKQSPHRGRNHPAGCCNRTRLSDWNASAMPTDTATAARSLAMQHSGAADLPAAISHELLNSKRESSSLAGIARTADFGHNQPATTSLT